ncbi:hypothetical protein AURDEDRAFT_111653 [Auricularia subglabra TFB-10046 SS5]|nr:hypothetical protein AURDEDRAFT_111653 [Auricularia subglabra TFB-10046 SS5]
MELCTLTARGTGDGPLAVALWACYCTLTGGAAHMRLRQPEDLSFAAGRSYDEAKELAWSYLLEARGAAEQLLVTGIGRP